MTMKTDLTLRLNYETVRKAEVHCGKQGIDLSEFVESVLQNAIYPMDSRPCGWPSLDQPCFGAVDQLRSCFPTITFSEPDLEAEYCSDIDFLGHVGDRAFGLQIKPVTSKANFGNYSPSERMRASFAEFTEQFGGKVFIVYSLDKEVANPEVVDHIRREVERLSA